MSSVPATVPCQASPGDSTSAPKDLPQVKKAFDAKQIFRKEVLSRWAKRDRSTPAHNDSAESETNDSMRESLEEMEKAPGAEQHVMHSHASSPEGGSIAGEDHGALADALSSVPPSTVPE